MRCHLMPVSPFYFPSMFQNSTKMTEKYALFTYTKSFIFNIYYLYIKYLYGLANFAFRSITAKTKKESY